MVLYAIRNVGYHYYLTRPPNIFISRKEGIFQSYFISGGTEGCEGSEYPQDSLKISLLGLDNLEFYH